MINMSSPSVITNRDRDCLSCRLISGGGLVGAGIYVSYCSKQFNKTPGKSIMFSFAGGNNINIIVFNKLIILNYIHIHLLFFQL